jgi:regulator of sirC expression with transglutaminase-like and TPR domain
MDATERFTALVQRADDEIPLDEAALLIAAHDHDVDVQAELDRLDALAQDAPTSADALVAHLFGELGFAGNAVDYGDPRNSYLDEVLRRRLGLPITLSLLVIEVGRRCDLRFAGVGMPGHFLVRADPATFYDPFHGGERLDEDGCRRVFARAQPDATFHARHLTPIGARAILARMLANLVHTFVQRAPASAVWALRLRLRVPGVPPAERRDAAALLGTLGSFEEAAAELDALTDELDGEAATRAERDAAALRARGN